MSKDPKWNWPKDPRHTDRNGTPLVDRMKGIPSLYAAPRPPFCYPGTTLHKGLLGHARNLQAAQLNHIGTHTHDRAGDHPAEGGFDDTQHMEAEAVWMLAGVLGGDRDTVDGYFCGGGTEANVMGIWIGREYLRTHPDPMGRGIAVLCTSNTHYSVHKACALTDIGQSGLRTCVHCSHPHQLIRDPRGTGVAYVGMNERGEMDVAALEQTFKQLYEDGFRRFIIVGSVGTTVLGSVDPIKEIGAFIDQEERKTNARFYLHVDASIGGFTVPFVNPNLAFGFNVPRVMSIAMDGDKMGQLPYPAGIFLCRRDLQLFAARTVPYISGHQDDTLSGSRSSLAPVLAWYQFQSAGISGQRDYVEKCLRARDRLMAIFTSSGLPSAAYHPLPTSPWVNLLPMVFATNSVCIPKVFLGKRKKTVDGVMIPAEPEPKEGFNEKGEPFPELAEFEGFLEPYHLRSDFFPGNPADPDSCPVIVHKLCIMPHMFGVAADGTIDDSKLRQFVDDLKSVENAWNRWKSGI